MKSPKIQSDIRFKIDAAFKQNNIAIPFPQRDIHIINK
jgi:small-conductance mechanosensitive channel